MPGVHGRRRDRIRALLAEGGLPGWLLVSSPANVRYLTGFSGSNGLLMLGPEAASDLLGTDGRYVDQAAQECPGLPVLIERDTLPALLGRMEVGLLGVEESLTWGQIRQITAVRGEPITIPCLIEAERSVKDAGEIALLEEACRVTSSAMEQLAREVEVGASEIALARRLEQLFGECGGDDRAFSTIVASGPNSAVPHHRPGHRRLEAGDLLVVDAGASVGGYHADMTRTFVVGAAPTEQQASIHAAVLAAQQRAIEACRAGAVASDLDAAARSALRDAGLEDRFTHGLGHGVGLQIHEAPGINARALGTLMGDMAFTVEPGAYLPGWGGVRIEDTLVVDDSGPRVLTFGSRELRVVGV